MSPSERKAMIDRFFYEVSILWQLPNCILLAENRVHGAASNLQRPKYE
ncbi:MAG: hypothetical protein ACI80I_002515 [Akkermansiaceae bacterium]|jgi:hypothetical protein